MFEIVHSLTRVVLSPLRKHPIQNTIEPVFMNHSPSPLVNNDVHEDDDGDNEHQKLHDNFDGGDDDDDADDDNVNCLSSIFPNTDDNPFQYVYTSELSDRVVSMETRLKPPRNMVNLMETRDAESGCVINVESTIKKDDKDDVDLRLKKLSDCEESTRDEHHSTTNEHAGRVLYIEN